MGIFRRTKQNFELTAPVLEAKLEHLLERKEEANSHFHDIKSVCGPLVIDIFLEALAKGRIKKEPKHG